MKQKKIKIIYPPIHLLDTYTLQHYSSGFYPRQQKTRGRCTCWRDDLYFTFIKNTQDTFEVHVQAYVYNQRQTIFDVCMKCWYTYRSLSTATCLWALCMWISCCQLREHQLLFEKRAGQWITALLSLARGPRTHLFSGCYDANMLGRLEQPGGLEPAEVSLFFLL